MRPEMGDEVIIAGITYIVIYNDLSKKEILLKVKGSK